MVRGMTLHVLDALFIDNTHEMRKRPGLIMCHMEHFLKTPVMCSLSEQEKLSAKVAKQPLWSPPHIARNEVFISTHLVMHSRINDLRLKNTRLSDFGLIWMERSSWVIKRTVRFETFCLINVLRLWVNLVIHPSSALVYLYNLLCSENICRFLFSNRLHSMW